MQFSPRQCEVAASRYQDELRHDRKILITIFEVQQQHKLHIHSRLSKRTQEELLKECRSFFVEMSRVQFRFHFNCFSTCFKAQVFPFILFYISKVNSQQNSTGKQKGMSRIIRSSWHPAKIRSRTFSCIVTVFATLHLYEVYKVSKKEQKVRLFLCIKKEVKQFTRPFFRLVKMPSSWSLASQHRRMSV